MSPLMLHIRLINGRRAICLVLVTALMAIATWFGIRKTAARQEFPPRFARPADERAIAQNYGELPLSFERNEGQTDARAKFISRGVGYDLFLTNTGAVLSLRKQDPQNQNAAGPTTQLVSVLNLTMVGADPKASIAGQEELPGKVNYFASNDPAAWRTNVPTFRKVKYAGIFSGVDLVYYG